MAENKQQPLTDEKLQELKDLYQPDDYDVLRPGEPHRPSFSAKVLKATYSRVRSLVFKEAAGAAEIPGLNFGLALYDTYEWGMEIYHLYREEKKILAALKEKEKIEALFKKSDKIAFYKKMESERATASRRLEKNIKSINDEEEQIQRLGARLSLKKDKYSIDHPHERNFVQTSFAAEKDMIKSKLERVKNRSFEERISKTHDNPLAQRTLQKNLNVAEQRAINFEKNKFVGSAEDKHHYLLTYAVKKLGKEHFDPVMHPERITRLHQYSALRLYSDGYAKHEIKSALSNDVFIKNMEGASQHIEELTSDSRIPYKSLNNIQDWRIKNGVSLLDRRTPAEYNLAQEMVKREEQLLSFHRGEIKFAEAKAAKDKYIEDFKKGIDQKLSTTDEYRVELGRNHDLGIFNNVDDNISIKLKLAGHREDEIIKALNEASPHASTKDYGQLKFIEARRFLITPQGREMTETINQLKAKHPHLENETRLNRLNLHTQENPNISYYRENNVRHFDKTVDYLHPEERGR
ncbi:hypothetical protein G7B40_030875 [Aetokthonos hydrillicola Thurmond2011]|jgi:hypothetical protein|uniref:Uncharacterized protein n=1 Tax=Aetokthonos hydrillicola Thurmond2011 TaxID=2712845 RepID=A0AAP5ICD1_9CYAN|nr:hypothetical protein [Aetokthonos hydrillicola]MBO3463389.1 hypothetical protein [Aetokthonos hydrillicola CCALA 1050]MBW4589674.1 hypothetical protein [Aetokthonos hydrillicola CCALA 1050]MDR9898928.1 hypothetical protein [Aetokthonos hydrillicola Thurmond2011]